jgi:hypothetical protein
MSSLDTPVKFDVSSVGLFQLMTAGMLENNARPFLDGEDDEKSKIEVIISVSNRSSFKTCSSSSLFLTS